MHTRRLFEEPIININRNRKRIITATQLKSTRDYLVRTTSSSFSDTKTVTPKDDTMAKRFSPVLLLSDSDDSTRRNRLLMATTNPDTKKYHHYNNNYHLQITNKSYSQTSSIRLARSKATLVLVPSQVLLLVSLVAALLLFTSTTTLEAIKLQPEGREKFYWSGEQFVITCQNTNNIKNVKIRWIGPNGSDITEDRSQRVHAESTGPHGHRLVVMNATAPDDEGQYKCTIGSADDRNPREHIEFNLKVYRQTSFKDTPRHLVLTAGQQGTLTCRVEFDPAALSTGVSWVRDQRPIEMFNDSTYTVLDYDANKQLSQLIISPLTKQHDGVYTCRAMAETSRLSKISDFDIQLETNYAPTFDLDHQTVWVERHRAGSSGSARAAPDEAASRLQQTQFTGNYYPHGSPRGSAHQAGVRNRHNRPGYTGPAVARDESTAANSTPSALGLSNNNIVQVELRCTCQANPPASILWTSTQNSMYVLAKGEPAHVLEEPRVELSGPNTTSILLIGYNLDQDWQFKRDSYICSASNKLGKASKTFTIEQGDPPPAFNVGPHRQYNPETSLFKFTLLGPNFDEQSSVHNNNNRSQLSSMHSTGVLNRQQQQQSHEIVPPVDSFRIRAEVPNDLASSQSSSSSSHSGEPKSSYSRSRLHHHQQQLLLEPLSVNWSLEQPLSFNSNRLIVPQNFTVNLGRLPSGNQRLFLEAHNAVGWSPESTYLGEYYIVSGASSVMMVSASATIILFSLMSSTLMLSSVLLDTTISKRPNLCLVDGAHHQH